MLQPQPPPPQVGLANGHGDHSHSGQMSGNPLLQSQPPHQHPSAPILQQSQPEEFTGLANGIGSLHLNNPGQVGGGSGPMQQPPPPPLQPQRPPMQQPQQSQHQGMANGMIGGRQPPPHPGQQQQMTMGGSGGIQSQPQQQPMQGYPPQPPHGQKYQPQPGPGQGFPPQPTAGQGFPPQPQPGQGQGFQPPRQGFPSQQPPAPGQGYQPPPGVQHPGAQQQPLPPLPGQGFASQPPGPGQGYPPKPGLGHGYPPTPGMGPGPQQQPSQALPPQPGQGFPPPPGQQQQQQPGQGYPPPPGQGLGAQQPPLQRYPQPPSQPNLQQQPGQGYGRPPGPAQGMGLQQPGYPPQPQPQQPGLNQGYPPQPGLGPGQGYGAQPSQPHLPPGMAFPTGAGAPVPGQGRKLDPDHMPSAIGVMQEDQQGRGGVFQTGQRGLLPPLVTTKFQVEDMGNASPRFVRSTMYSVPAQPDMMKQTCVPFALVVNPFEEPGEGEAPLACVDLGPMGPVRCIRCKAYMSPLMQFIDGGRRFQCLLCKATTEVPPEYFQHLDHTGMRVDKWERPELWRGSYEFMATLEYCRNSVNPKEPGYVFVIDVSYNNVKSGLVNLICNQMPSLLEMIPSHTPVGFITYNSKVHFYNIDPSLAQPQMVIVPDVADMFMPILTGFMVPRAEAAKSVAALMIQIPAMFSDTKETDAVLGPAIQGGLEALKASERVGKLLVMHSTLPSSDAAPGKLKNREGERKLLGTDKEKVVLTPQSTYYNTLGQDCVASGVSVDLYLFNNSYIDVATIGQVARVTGGSVNKYTYFQADIDGARVIGELKYHLSRPTGFDGVMRVRTSTGVRPTDFHGHFFMSNTTDIELGAIDSYKGIAVEIKHDDKLTDDEGVYIQIALLYTSIYGQRRIRLHNLALNTCLQMADLYRNCELDTIINFLARQCISKSVDATPQTIKDGVINRCAQMLATYRKHCANPSMPGQLILPECLKLLPLYVNCVLRSDAVSGNSELTPDDRSWLMYTVMTMGVGSSVHYFYPKLIPIAGPTAEDGPSPIRCSHDKLRDDSAFILENGIYIFLWIGSAVSSEWLSNVFGISNLAQINVEVITELPEQVNTDESLKLKALIRSLRTQRQRHMRLTIVRQRDKMELVMSKFLVEDRSSDGHPSYVDFLCHMHKEIRGILNQ